MKRKKIKAVIFDLDGTLLDTLDDIAESANKVLRQHGFEEHQTEAYRYFVGNGLQVLMQRIMPQEATADEIRSGIETFEAYYEERWHLKTVPYPGIIDLLTSLKDSGLKLAVLSNKPDSFTQKCVTHYFSEIGFDVVAGKKEAMPPKPDPLSALQILKLFELSPQESVFVGDSSVDISTGRNAGMVTVGVDWGFRTRDELIEAGAQAVISVPEDLKDYVL